MSIIAIMPPEFRAVAEQLKLSPGIVSNNQVFLSGITGSGTDGHMPKDPVTQFGNAFDKIGITLQEVGLSFQSIVEMTTYHVGLKDHIDQFNAVRLEYCGEPFPAWTAVEVAGLRRVGALVEIRVVANIEV
ncbi:MAG: RidA family protein [Cohaesibacteraceae bacterium]|nr:RidA family protein [Cohaesibacteraceae bacterium]